MPSRKTVLNWSDCANFAPKETVTPSPRLDLPAIGYSLFARAHGYAPSGKLARLSEHTLDQRLGQKKSRHAAAQEVNREASNRVAGHSHPEDWMAENLVQSS